MLVFAEISKMNLLVVTDLQKMFVDKVDILLIVVYSLNVEGQQNGSTCVFLEIEWAVVLNMCLADSSLCTSQRMVKQ